MTRPSSERRTPDESHTRLVTAARRLADAVTRTDVDPEVLERVTRDVDALTTLLQARASDRHPQTSPEGGEPRRSPTLLPLVLDSIGETHTLGRVTFTAAHRGGGGYVHGGFLGLLFDDVLGRVAARCAPRSRTAYLHVDYRAVTPPDRELDFSARLVESQGRKVHVEGRLECEGQLLSEARALFVVLRDGQP